MEQAGRELDADVTRSTEKYDRDMLRSGEKLDSDVTTANVLFWIGLGIAGIGIVLLAVGRNRERRPGPADKLAF